MIGRRSGEHTCLVRVLATMECTLRGSCRSSKQCGQSARGCSELSSKFWGQCASLDSSNFLVVWHWSSIDLGRIWFAGNQVGFYHQLKFCRTWGSSRVYPTGLAHYFSIKFKLRRVDTLCASIYMTILCSQISFPSAFFVMQQFKLLSRALMLVQAVSRPGAISQIDFDITYLSQMC